MQLSLSPCHYLEKVQIQYCWNLCRNVCVSACVCMYSHVHMQHCLHTRACRDMSQVVKMSGWRRLGPKPRMHEWKSTDTIVLTSDTEAIFRVWDRVGFENVAQSVCRETLGKGKSSIPNSMETMVIYANVSCWNFWGCASFHCVIE